MAYEAYVAILGDKQGEYPAEATRTPHKETKRAPVLRVDYMVVAPTDLQKTSLANERRHEPLTLLKEVGAMTPLLNQAANRGETLKSVQIVFYRPVPAPGEGSEHYFTIDLYDARVVGHRIFTGKKGAQTYAPGSGAMASSLTSKTAAPHDTLELEEVTLWFRKIVLTAVTHNVQSADDWDQQVGV